MLSKKEKSRLKSQRMRKNLTDGYVRSVIIESMLYKLKKTDPLLTYTTLSAKTVITKEMITDKRKAIQDHQSLKRAGLKICITCKTSKKRDEFYCNKGQINHSCKNCSKDLQKHYAGLNKEKYRIRDRKRAQTGVDNLDKWYLQAVIKQNIKKTTNIVIKSSEIPDELLELTTSKLLIQRKIANGNKKNQNQGG